MNDRNSVQLASPAPGTWWLHPPDGGEMYLLETSTGLVMVDTGMPRHKEAAVQTMHAHGLDPARVVLGIMTHCHCDHVGAMGWWREKYGFPVMAHRETAGPVERGDEVVTGADIPYAGFHEPFIPCPVDRIVEGGEQFSIGTRAFRLFVAPGHTTGGLTIVVDDTLVFVGDNVFEGGGIGWMDVHWGSNPADYVETLDRLRAYCGLLTLPGHGAPFILRPDILKRAREIASFYIPTDHGLGAPRAPSQYSGPC